jgi:hypothetical protein
MRKIITAALVAVAGVLGFASTDATGASAATHRPASTHDPTVAFDWWRGTHYQSHWFGSIRPTVFGNSFGNVVTNLTWQYWDGSTSALGFGLLYKMSCQPCHVKIRFLQPKPDPSNVGAGMFFNWMNFTLLGQVEYERWSFAQGEWVGR